MRWWPFLVLAGACAAPSSPTSLVDPSLLDPTLVLTDLELSPARYPVPADELRGIQPPEVGPPQASCDDPLPSALSPAFSTGTDVYRVSAVPGDAMCIRSASDDPGHVGLLWQGANDAAPTLCDGACTEPLVAAGAAFPVTFQLVGLDDDGTIVRASEPVAVDSLTPTFDCATDPLESNDTKATAIESGIGPGTLDVTFTGLAICAHGDVDIFHVSLAGTDHTKTLAATAWYPAEQLFVNIIGENGEWGEGPGGVTDDGQLGATAEYTSIPPGEWWIKISGRPSVDGANGGPEFSTVDNYDLHIQVLDQPLP